MDTLEELNGLASLSCGPVPLAKVQIDNPLVFPSLAVCWRSSFQSADFISDLFSISATFRDRTARESPARIFILLCVCVCEKNSSGSPQRARLELLYF